MVIDFRYKVRGGARQVQSILTKYLITHLATQAAGPPRVSVPTPRPQWLIVWKQWPHEQVWCNVIVTGLRVAEVAVFVDHAGASIRISSSGVSTSARTRDIVTPCHKS